MRHAETETLQPSVKDFERPLTEQGRLEARKIGEYLSANELQPDLILHSSAQRARETVQAMVKRLSAMPDIRESRALYMASPDDITSSARSSPDDADTVAVVGHSPGLPTAALIMANPTTDLDIIDDVTHGYPPGSFVVLRFDIECWKDVDHAQANLESFVRPSEMELAFNLEL